MGMYDERGRSSGGGGGRILIAVVIAVISLISYFSKSVVNPVTHEKQHVSISPEQEIALGLHAAPQMEAQNGGLSRNRQAQAKVEEVGRRLVERTAASKTPYRFQFHLLASPNTINAFALPGGQVFITEALYDKLQTEGQLAGVLGHEIGHVVARHGAQQLAKQELTQGLTGAAVMATYDPNNPSSRQSAAVAMAVGQLVNLRYGRQDELQADNLSVRFTAEAGYDPRSMLAVMQILKEASPGKTPEFFSTHPNPDHRSERIQEAIAKEFPQGIPAGLQK